MFQKLAATFSFAAFVAACSGGAGAPIKPGPSSDRAAGGLEGATGSAEGARGGTDPGACLPCRAYYQCTGTIQGQAVNGGQTLGSGAPSCPVTQDKKDQAAIYLACGGSIHSGSETGGVLPPNSVVGTWKDVGAGVLVACFGFLGVDDCITCTPAIEPVADTPSGGTRRDAG